MCACVCVCVCVYSYFFLYSHKLSNVQYSQHRFSFESQYLYRHKIRTVITNIIYARSMRNKMDLYIAMPE